MTNKLIGIGIVAILAATLGITAIGFSQAQAVPKECAGNPHDHDSGTSGNPHDANEPTGNPHDQSSGGHHHEGPDC
jgi:hypothetical protein